MIRKEKLTPKLFELAKINVQASASLKSCLILLIILILAGTALVVKWALLQPIHNEIVEKYRTDQPVFFIQNRFCDSVRYDGINLVTFPFGCCLIILLVIRTKRVKLMKDRCSGYGALPMPLNFFSYRNRKFAAVVFALTVEELIFIVGETISGTSFKELGVIVSYLFRLFQVTILGVKNFSFLAAVHGNSLLPLIATTIYAWTVFTLSVAESGMCSNDFYPTYEDFVTDNSSINSIFKIYGTGQALIAIQVTTDIPRFLCLAYISVKMPMFVIKKFRQRYSKDLPHEELDWIKLTHEERLMRDLSRPDSVEMMYIKNLLRANKQRPRSRSFWGRFIPTFIYEWRDDFNFSSRIICLYSSILLLLYFTTIDALVQIIPTLDSLRESLQILFDAIGEIFTPLSPYDGVIDGSTTNFPVPRLIRPYACAVTLAVVIILIQLFVFLANIRRNLLQAYRGDDSEIPRRDKTRYVSYAVGNVHFGGYFLGYLIWGFILVVIFAFILCFSIEAFIVFGSVRLVEKILKAIIPSLLFIVFKQYVNRILVKYVFLQKRGEVLAANNRRLLMIFIYFNFFLDAFLGFISSIMRLVRSIIGGILYMCRLDYSPLGRKLEGFDGGFNAYCGFIHTECTHRHPIMLVFVSLLYTQMKIKRAGLQSDDTLSLDHSNSKSRTRQTIKYRHKWQLAVFLIQNPALVFFRKTLLRQSQQVNVLNQTKNLQNASLPAVMDHKKDDIIWQRF